MRYRPPAFLAPPPPAVAIPTRVRADADCCGVGVARCRVEGKPLAGRRSSWGGPALPANDPPLGQQPGVAPPGRLPAPVAGLHAPHPIGDQGMPYLVSTEPCVAKVCKAILGLVRPRTPPSRARTPVPACFRSGLRCRPCPGAGLWAKRAAERRRIRCSGLSQRMSAADQAVGTAYASHPRHHLHHSVIAEPPWLRIPPSACRPPMPSIATWCSSFPAQTTTSWCSAGDGYQAVAAGIPAGP